AHARAGRGRGAARDLLAAIRFRIGDRLLLVGFRLLLARALFLALHVLALFLCDVELGLGLGDLGFVRGVLGAFVLRLEIGLANLLVGLGFLVADVLRVTAQ